MSLKLFARGVCVFTLLVLVSIPAGARAAGGSPVRGGLHRAGRWLVDDQGRVVVLHGFNIVRKNPPYVRTEFSDADARLLAREGFTAARIGFIWAGVEPQPGHYDDRYIAGVLRLDSLLGRYGIRTLVDFHQDAWSHAALPTLGDGAPAWATVGSDSVQAASDSFAAFWRNAPGPGGVRIQTRFRRAWRHVAIALRTHFNILGLDPFNEPYPGPDYPPPCGAFTRCPQFETGALAAFYRRVIRAIRSAGAEQVIFPEGVAESGYQPPVLPRFADPETAFNFHFYCGQTQVSALDVPVGAPSPQAAACAPIERTNIGRFIIYAKQLAVPGFLSEFSCTDVNPDNAQIVDLVGRSFTSWTAWAYYTGADDPADCAHQGLLSNDKAPGSEANAKQEKLDAFAVPYAVAIAGTPRATSLNRAKRTYRLAYRSAGVPGTHLKAGAETVIFLPARMYSRGYVAHVSGARVRSRANARWLLLAAERARSVSVRITPR